MKAFKRKKGSGRPKKRDDSDIPEIIDELNDEQKDKLLKIELKRREIKKIEKSFSNR